MALFSRCISMYCSSVSAFSSCSWVICACSSCTLLSVSLVFFSSSRFAMFALASLSSLWAVSSSAAFCALSSLRDLTRLVMSCMKTSCSSSLSSSRTVSSVTRSLSEDTSCSSSSLACAVLSSSVVFSVYSSRIAVMSSVMALSSSSLVLMSLSRSSFLRDSSLISLTNLYASLVVFCACARIFCCRFSSSALRRCRFSSSFCRLSRSVFILVFSSSHLADLLWISCTRSFSRSSARLAVVSSSWATSRFFLVLLSSASILRWATGSRPAPFLPGVAAPIKLLSSAWSSSLSLSCSLIRSRISLASFLSSLFLSRVSLCPSSSASSL
mmetsp:Transcript_7437/g.18007  ORF Transcript_7437/g.18007 Transcript_7437/m.18007 type:complete len:327 (-) Transcript_7437:374-1354(-)